MAYTAVKQRDDEEAGEKLISPPNADTSRAKVQLLLVALVAFICGIGASVVFQIIMYDPQVSPSPSPSPTEAAPLSDVNPPPINVTEPMETKFRTPVPEMPTESVVFEFNTTFAESPNTWSQYAWNTLLPPGRGFVFVENGTSYGLEPGQDTEWGEIYSVSMFHQLHCLGELRAMHWKLDRAINADDLRNAKYQLSRAGHLGHCWDYLRQGITCAGDMTLEWPRTEPDGTRLAVDGWGIPHQCKSFDSISDYMAKSHFNNSGVFDIAP